MEVAQKIIHVDMDMFFVAVEIRDNPKLKDLPVAIGGPRQTRGVLSTANYIARKFGVRSAMPTSQALRLCPDLVLLNGNMQKYVDESSKIFAIFKSFTSEVEGLSLDEAYLDVSQCNLFGGSATLIAKEIKARIFRETGLTASAGVGPNKLIAKLASDMDKPDGLTVVRPQDVDHFISKVAVAKIFGVGKVAQEKMAKIGVQSCADLQKLNLYELVDIFGSFGQSLYKYCRGIDSRRVVTNRPRKSYSLERTFVEDLSSWDQIEIEFLNLYERWQSKFDLWSAKNKGRPIYVTGLKVKLRSYTFETTTVELKSLVPQKSDFLFLLKQAYSRLPYPVRLLGLGVKLNVKTPIEDQVNLFD